MPNNILIKGEPFRKEGKVAAGQTITPGALLDRNSAGELIDHAGQGLNASPLFAIEDNLQGKGVDDNYAAGNQIQYNVCKPGDVVYALLADGNNVNPTHFLESNGDGTLRLHTPQAVDEGGTATFTLYNRAIVGRPLESINNTSGGAVRIQIEVI